MSNTNAHSSPITEGKVLSQPVYTRRGNLLLEQGTKITPAVMELLDVFQLSDVVLNTGDLAVDTSSKSLTEKDESNQEEKTTAPLLIQEKSTSAPHPTTVLQRDNNCSCHEVIEEFKQLLKCFQDNRPYSFSSLKKKIEKMLNELSGYSPLYSNHYFTDMAPFYRHSLLVSLTSNKLAEWSGMNAPDSIDAALAGLLHDIGKMKVTEQASSIDSKESGGHGQDGDHMRIYSSDDVKRKRLIAGFTWLKSGSDISEAVRLAVFQHYEQPDGKGFPLGLRKDKIHPIACIVAVANRYHEENVEDQISGKKISTPPNELTNDLNFLQSPYLRMEKLLGQAFGKLDPVLIQVFVRKLTSGQQGNRVLLNGIREGKVVFTPPSSPTRPWIKVNKNIVDLAKETHLFISEIWPVEVQ